MEYNEPRTCWRQSSLPLELVLVRSFWLPWAHIANSLLNKTKQFLLNLKYWKFSITALLSSNHSLHVLQSLPHASSLWLKLPNRQILGIWSSAESHYSITGQWKSCHKIISHPIEQRWKLQSLSLSSHPQPWTPRTARRNIQSSVLAIPCGCPHVSVCPTCT